MFNNFLSKEYLDRSGGGISIFWRKKEIILLIFVFFMFLTDQNRRVSIWIFFLISSIYSAYELQYYNFHSKFNQLDHRFIEFSGSIWNKCFAKFCNYFLQRQTLRPNIWNFTLSWFWKKNMSMKWKRILKLIWRIGRCVKLFSLKTNRFHIGHFNRQFIYFKQPLIAIAGTAFAFGLLETSVFRRCKALSITIKLKS